MPRSTRKTARAGKAEVDNTLSNNDDDEDSSVACANTTEVLRKRRTETTHFEIPYSNKNISCILIGTPESPLALIFTQGAGGNITSPAVANFAKGFAQSKNIFCFQGRSQLEERTRMFRTVTEHYPCEVIGGRSIGARTAITTAKEIGNVKTLILASYPLVGAKGDVRDQLLLDIDGTIHVLFVMGDRDSMCELNALRQLMKRMKAKTWMIVAKNANHGMEMRPSKATEAMGTMVGRVVAEWIERHDVSLTECELHWDDDENKVIVGPWMR